MELKTNNQVVKTKYNIGDRVVIENIGKKYESFFYLDEIDSNGFNKTEKRPVVWQIDEIEIFVRKDNIYVQYRVSYNEPSCISPKGNQTISENGIMYKVESTTEGTSE